jgi:Domain of unknown function (DUF1848)
MNRGRPLIISASRRTDLPGFYPESCAARIRQKVSRLRTRFLYGVVFWTRYTRPFLKGGPLRDLTRVGLANPIVNLTLTGLGSTALEPGVPTTDDVLANLPELVDTFHGEPWRIRWRFDPILKGWSTVEDFRRIAEVMSGLQVPDCTFSFPTYRSLKGDLTPQFERAKIPRWNNIEKIEFLSEMANVADSLGITLLSCSQPENIQLEPSIKEAQCIPRNVLERGHPDGLLLELEKDFSQRKACQCIQSDDIGSYDTDRCKSGCVYCYSRAGGE